MILPGGGRAKFLTFGYNRFKQLPLVIGCPGGRIIISREPPATVRVDFQADGATMADHLGTIKAGSSAQTHGGRYYTVRLVHEEVKGA